jgi:tripartite-type tricarboxylate transporter receptor subunit TctC
MVQRSLRVATLFTALAVLAGLLAPPHHAAWAQGYPAGPITVVVSFPPGGSIDVVLRAMAPKLQERLGRPVVVENRAGGGGVIATAAVAKAAPDGHMLLASASSLASNPALFKALPFDTLKDFQMVALLFRTPLVLVVNPGLPAQSVGELIALAKQKPGEISFAQSGPGSAVHLAAELFQAMTGTKMNGIAYRGAPPALNDVMAGHIALMFPDAGSVMSLIAGGKVRALGVTSTARVPSLPDVPTIAESGVAGFDAEGWTMIAVPAATPAAVVERLRTEMAAAVASPDVQALIVRLGLIPVASPPPAALQKFLASEINRWGGIIEKAGVAKSQ